MTFELSKEEFRKAYVDFNINDEHSIANVIMHWIRTDVNPFIPPIIMRTLKVPQVLQDKAMIIVIATIGADKVDKWEDQINA